MDRPGWTARPVLALVVRAVQYGLPLLAGTFVARLIGSVADGHLARHWTIGLALLVAVVVSLLVSRLTLRLAPLAMLLQMTMIFPDHAPSRLKVARRSTSATEITRRLTSQSPDEQDAAVTMLALVTALGKHDRHTRGHSERVRLFCDLLSRQLGLSAEDSGRLRWAALVHDIGKLEVSSSVLNKPGKLAADEWTAVRRHPEAGARLAQPLAQWLGPWYAGIMEHHERYDGGGYPMGLSGQQISVAGRAIAVVDAYETMTAARSYKAAKSAVAARAELARSAGTHFDPTMVRAFLAIALPRLLWSVGPLAFVINTPFLRWIGDGSTRLSDVAAAGVSGAANAAGVTAAVVAAGAMPGAVASSALAHSDTLHSVVRQSDATAVSREVGRTQQVRQQAARPAVSPTTTATTTAPAAAVPGTAKAPAGSGQRATRTPAAQRPAPPMAMTPEASPETTTPAPEPQEHRGKGGGDDDRDDHKGKGDKSKGDKSKGDSHDGDKSDSHKGDKGGKGGKGDKGGKDEGHRDKGGSNDGRGSGTGKDTNRSDMRNPGAARVVATSWS